METFLEFRAGDWWQLVGEALCYGFCLRQRFWSSERAIGDSLWEGVMAPPHDNAPGAQNGRLMARPL